MKREIHYTYSVMVCDLSTPVSNFVTIAKFNDDEKDKVNALVNLLRERSNLSPEAVMVTHDPAYFIPIDEHSPLIKPVEAAWAKRHAAFDALKVKVEGAI